MSMSKYASVEDYFKAQAESRTKLLAKAYTLLLQVDQIGVQGKEIDKLITEIKKELGL